MSEENLDDEYFTDDDFFLQNDSILDNDLTSAVIKQEDSDEIIIWEVTGFKDDNGNIKKAKDFKKTPPVMTFKTSAGDEANFVLTKELTTTLKNVFNDVNRAYHNIPPANHESIPAHHRALQWIKEHKFLSIFSLVILIVLFFSVLL